MGQIKVEKNVGGIEGLCVITPAVHGDNRGYFMETYSQRDMAEVGLDIPFVQDNQSMSVKGVLRGLHFQKQYPQTKLVRVIKGSVFDVAVDLRSASDTYGKWFGVLLTEENQKQFLIPKGFAHGFLVLSDTAVFCYKCDDFYHANDEGGLAWNDPEIGIRWPEVVGEYRGSASAEGYALSDGTSLKLSDKDQKWLGLREAFDSEEQDSTSDVMVSIYVPTYNHEKYITQALDSILMQKTQYTYEVFVGEDCSTDNTRQVLKDWEKAHPGKFHILYRDENMNNKPIYNSLDLQMRCRGKYIICLEGDDFWTDPLKLEKQVTFLETHPEYYAVAHNCTVVGADSVPNGEQYPECKDEVYTLRHFASEIMPGQLTTLLIRNYMIDEGLDSSLIRYGQGPGDRHIFFTLACHSKIFCMQESMSAYRHITSGGSSYSANYVHVFEKEELPRRNRLEYAEKLGQKEAILCARMQYLLYLRYAERNGYADKKALAEARQRIPHRWAYLPLILKRDVNRSLLHRTPHF